MTTCEQCRELIWDELFGLLEPARRTDAARSFALVFSLLLIFWPIDSSPAPFLSERLELFIPSRAKNRIWRYPSGRFPPG